MSFGEFGGTYLDYESDLIRKNDELVAALKLLLETHCCDNGSAEYRPEWDGDHTVCDDCRPAYRALGVAGSIPARLPRSGEQTGFKSLPQK